MIDSDQNCVLSGQERWFTTLPPVLFLELSRFQFNTSKGIAEKVNNVPSLNHEQHKFCSEEVIIEPDIPVPLRHRAKMAKKAESSGLSGQIKKPGGDEIWI